MQNAKCKEQNCVIISEKQTTSLTAPERGGGFVEGEDGGVNSVKTNTRVKMSAKQTTSLAAPETKL